jgi:hypothetical protein
MVHPFPRHAEADALVFLVLRETGTSARVAGHKNPPHTSIFSSISHKPKKVKPGGARFENFLFQMYLQIVSAMVELQGK